jgi:aldose 1-epimerase
MTPTTGKLGAQYAVRSGLCLEPQAYPDAVHNPAFDSTILEPGDVYRTTSVYRLSVTAEE